MNWLERCRKREIDRRNAAELGLPIPGTGRRPHGGPCPEGDCDWCEPRKRWNRSRERAQIKREVTEDRG